MRVALLVGITLLSGCDRAFALHRQDASVDAPPDAPPSCLTDPAYRSLGTIPESRYAIAAQPTSWIEARDACRALGAHLVVDSHLDAEWSALTGGDRLANAHWIGISDLSQVAVFASLTDEAVGLDRPPWATNQPENVAGEDCVALTAGTLDNVNCDGPFLAACECELPVTCTLSASPTHDYMVLPAATTWDGAHAACSAIAGYRLAVINDSEEDEYLRGRFAGGSLWIDATDRDMEGVWQTRDGCRPYLRWGRAGVPRQEPNGGSSENCAAIVDMATMELIDVNCEAMNISSLCETL